MRVERRLERCAELERSGRHGARSARARCSSGASDSSPATGSGSSARMPRSRTTTIPPPSSAEALHRPHHVAVVDPDADDVVGVVGDRRSRSRRAAGRARARARGRSGRCRGAARRRRSWPGRARGRRQQLLAATVGASVSDSVTIWPGTMPMTRAASPSVPGDAQIAERERRDPHGVAHPLGHRRRRDLARQAAPAVRTMSGTNRSRSGRMSRSARWAGATAPRPARPCHVAAFRVAITSASAGSTPSATASRTIAFTCPSAAMCCGSRSSVQSAIRCGPSSRASGISARRLRAPVASRIRSHMPARSRSRPSSMVVDSWSEPMPAAA